MWVLTTMAGSRIHSAGYVGVDLEFRKYGSDIVRYMSVSIPTGSYITLFEMLLNHEPIESIYVLFEELNIKRDLRS